MVMNIIEHILFNKVKRFYHKPVEALIQKKYIKDSFGITVNISRKFDKYSGIAIYELVMV